MGQKASACCIVISPLYVRVNNQESPQFFLPSRALTTGGNTGIPACSRSLLDHSSSTEGHLYWHKVNSVGIRRMACIPSMQTGHTSWIAATFRSPNSYNNNPERINSVPSTTGQVRLSLFNQRPSHSASIGVIRVSNATRVAST